MSDVSPCVGQIVYYGTTYEKIKFLPAIVTHIRESNRLDLTVFHPDAGPSIARNIPHSEFIQSGMWTWPEFGGK